MPATWGLDVGLPACKAEALLQGHEPSPFSFAYIYEYGLFKERIHSPTRDSL